jgi:hypothetical protein
LYDLVFVEQGPLPPHERSWRHPSELGPTRLDVDDTAARPHVSFIALAGGTMAVVAIAAMVVAMTPRPSGGPVALSATTTPITTRAIVERPSVETAVPAAATIEIRQRTALLTSFAAFPHTVTAGPQLDVDGTDVADATPDDDEMVFLRTEAVTYRLPWNEAKQLAAPDGTVIFDDDGELVARVAGGELVSLVAE